MTHYGWIIYVAKDDPKRQQLLDDIRQLVCLHFNLCASVGCRCAVGAGSLLHEESEVEHRRRMVVSDGPSWHVAASELDKAVIVDVYVLHFPSAEEQTNLHAAIMKFDKPTFTTRTKGDL